MFGPDVCGTTTRKTHVIVTHKDKNHLVKKNIRVDTEKGIPHRYTLALHANQTYEALIDGKKVESGSLTDAADFDILPPKTIKDPSDVKPADWVDDSQMDDPADVKPAGWDDIPAKIPDPDAKKPEDWDDEEDGEWEVPQIDNPAYKGAWKAKRIPNPAYKGAWVQKDMPNPEYKEDSEIYHVCKPCGAVGFELWQVKAGTLFDDIIVTDSLAELEAFAAETFDVKAPKEKEAFEAAEKKKKDEEEAERKKREEVSSKPEGQALRIRSSQRRCPSRTRCHRSAPLSPDSRRRPRRRPTPRRMTRRMQRMTTRRSSKRCAMSGLLAKGEVAAMSCLRGASRRACCVAVLTVTDLSRWRCANSCKPLITCKIIQVKLASV